MSEGDVDSTCVLPWSASNDVRRHEVKRLRRTRCLSRNGIYGICETYFRVCGAFLHERDITIARNSDEIMTLLLRVAVKRRKSGMALLLGLD